MRLRDRVNYVVMFYANEEVDTLLFKNLKSVKSFLEQLKTKNKVLKWDLNKDEFHGLVVYKIESIFKRYKYYSYQHAYPTLDIYKNRAFEYQSILVPKYAAIKFGGLRKCHYDGSYGDFQRFNNPIFKRTHYTNYYYFYDDNHEKVTVYFPFQHEFIYNYDTK